MRRFAPLLVGVALVAAGSLVGLDPALANAVFRGPIALRAVLSGLATILGLWLLFSAAGRLAGDDDASPRSFAEMIRAVRLVFLAIAAFAAASAFLVGDLLPLVVGLVIAGVDVAETALLLLVAGTHQRVEPPG
jgi:hypothetical protein